MWRKLGLLGLGLSVLQGILDLTGRDGAAGTAAEIAMLVTAFQGAAEPDKAGRATRSSDPAPASAPDLLQSLTP